MGFHNPPLRFSEMRARLEGRGGPFVHPMDTGVGATGDPDGAAAVGRGSEPSAVKDEPIVPYAELHAHSAYSFLDGVSMPEQYVAEAGRLGLAGLAITDHDGFPGAVRMAEAIAAAAAASRSGNPGSAPGPARRDALASVYGAELSLGLGGPQNGVPDPEGEHLLLLAKGSEGYHALAGAITTAQLAGGEKGRPMYETAQLLQQLSGRVTLLTGCRKSAVRRALEPSRGRFDPEAAARALDAVTEAFGRDAVFVEVFHHGDPLDDERNAILSRLAGRRRLPLVATGNVHYATPQEFPLFQAVSAVRARRSLDEAESWLPSAPAAHLRSGAEMQARFGRFPGAVENTVSLAQECAFSLRAVKPELPKLDLPGGADPMDYLRGLVWEAAERKYPGLPDGHRTRIEHELSVIAEKGFPGYFLIVSDIVRFARSRGILCQGRGSAAASAVCYLLDVTAVDAIRYELPFERFLSMIREEEPDIDIDFDSDRREEVIQYVYGKYGRRNAAQVANVISFTPKNAVRDMAKAFGFGPGHQDAWSKGMEHGALAHPEALEELGIPAPVLDLAVQLQGKPRHLGIHSGGMVLTARPIGEVVPIEHARMTNRTVLQWDKDDCEWMGLVKFDLLGLGILSAIQRSFDVIEAAFGRRLDLDAIPKEEGAVYDALCRADAIGIFQVESRAQLGLLPRLKPREFYDLAIEVALIRPGPIQGGAVHPFVERRDDPAKVDYLHPRLKPILKRTLGVPIFQEQIISMAVALSDLNPEEADLLRRAFGSKRGQQRIESIRTRLIEGMRGQGMGEEAIASVYAQIEAFANFGFAESHSLSFALLVYASAWIKVHYPAAFLAGLLRAQPMGFYSPASLVADARRHGVETRRPDINLSGVDAELERLDDASLPAAETGRDACLSGQQPPVGPFRPEAPDLSAEHRRDGAVAVRIGLAGVRAVGRSVAERIVAERRRGGPYHSMGEVARRAGISETQLESLATAGAFESFALDRRQALWNAGRAAQDRSEYLAGTMSSIAVPLFALPTDLDILNADLWSTGISVDDHRMAHVRPALAHRGVLLAADLATAEPGRRIEVAGVVIHRQRPRTASGMVFLNLEDESGMVNVICSAGAWVRFRRIARQSPALLVRGMLERSPDGVVNVVADWFEPVAAGGGSVSRDFR